MSTPVTTPTGQPLEQQPGEFTGSAPAHIITWQAKRVPPPSPLYVDVDDKLNVGVASSLAGEVVTFNYRLLLANTGTIVRGQFTVACPAAYTLVTAQEQLAEGFLLSVSAKAATAATRGQTFARVFVGSGPFGAGQPGYMLMADYVTTAMAPAFPNGRISMPVEGPGYPHTVGISNPSVGVDWQFSTAPEGRYLVRGVTATLVTNATVATRVPAFQVLSEFLAMVLEFTPTVGQTAGTTITYLWTPAPYAGVTSSGIVAAPMPDNLVLRYPQQLRSLTSGLQTGVGGDQWSNISFLVEEWLDNV